ncbi:MAG: metallophosphoesterase family protein [Sarcina sp.]
MGRVNRINKLLENVKVLNLKLSDKVVIFSDCHRGDGSFRDSLYPNSNIYTAALRYYYESGFIYIEDGDGDELWKFTKLEDIMYAHEDEYQILKNFKLANRFYMIYGNHDDIKSKKSFRKKILNSKNNLVKEFYLDLEIHEGILLNIEDKEYLIFHGHQVDFLSYEFAWLARFLVRYVWGFMNGTLSFREVLTPAKSDNLREKVDNRVYKWCEKNQRSVIIGHTHNTIFPEYHQAQYFNVGAAVLPYSVTCIEIQNGTIVLVKWSIKLIKNGILAVRKELVSNPRNI